MNRLLSAVDYKNHSSLGFRLRQRRSARIKTLIQEIYDRLGSVRIIDLGGRQLYWNVFDGAFLESRNVTITLLNPEHTQARPNNWRFVEIIGDACDVREFEDNSFDLVHSNSTIEHVGDWINVERFAGEARRLAPSYYVQTPYYWFPIEPHDMLPLFHWLPEGVRAQITLHTNLTAHGSASDLGAAMRSVQRARLLDRAQMSYLFPDAKVSFERVGSLPKSLLAIRA